MMSRNMPEAAGKYAVINLYVYSNHEVNMANRRSHSGIIIYVNNSSIVW